MSTVTQTTYEVFLAHGAKDQGIAAIVKEALKHAELDAYTVIDISPGEEFMSSFRTAMAECSAFILVLTPSTLGSQNVAFEVGAAMAWNKPIHIIYDGLSVDEIPAYLREFHVEPLTKLSGVVDQILKSREPLTEDEREALIDIYEDLAIPTDQLIRQPSALRDLWQRFQNVTTSSAPAERLIEELIRLRKQGKLPAIKRKRA